MRIEKSSPSSGSLIIIIITVGGTSLYVQSVCDVLWAVSLGLPLMIVDLSSVRGFHGSWFWGHGFGSLAVQL